MRLWYVLRLIRIQVVDRLRRIERKLDDLADVRKRVEWRDKEEERVRREEFARGHEARLHKLMSDPNRPRGGAIREDEYTDRVEVKPC